MQALYMAIIFGAAVLYYVHSQQIKEDVDVHKGNVSEGDFSQEAPPSNEDMTMLKKYIPDYDDQ